MLFTRSRGSDAWSIYSSDLHGGAATELVRGGFLGGDLVDNNTDLHGLIYGRFDAK